MIQKIPDLRRVFFLGKKQNAFEHKNIIFTK